MTYPKLLTIFLLACLSVAGCKSKKTEEHLPTKLMRDIMMDIQLAETYSTMQKDTLHKNTGMKNMDSLAVFYKDIFAHYKVTKEQFTNSLDWYKNNPEEMDSLYNDMLPVITAMQNQLPKPPVAPIMNKPMIAAPALPGKR